MRTPGRFEKKVVLREMDVERIPGHASAPSKATMML
jgi:hypothetical protein